MCGYKATIWDLSLQFYRNLQPSFPYHTPLFLIGIVKLGFIKSTCPLHGHRHNCLCQNIMPYCLHVLLPVDAFQQESIKL